jgi:predicted nucleic acid-binding protein
VTTVVLDASVAVKWPLSGADEPLKPPALELLQRYVDGQIQFIVPDIFWAEFANALGKAVRQGRHSAKSATTAISSALGRNFPVVPSKDLLPSAIAIALKFGRSVYDSIYVALAQEMGCDMITADERLANALAAYFPVKWLGAM